MKKSYFISLAAFSLLSALSFLATINQALAIPNTADLEVLHAKATLQYHSKQYRECQETLQQLLAKDVNNAPALELKALVHREQNQDDAAAETYTRLMENAADAKKAAYQFDLATIRYKQKKLDEARKYFKFAALNKFNPGTSYFFLGVMDFNEKKWKTASKNLAAALTFSDAQPMYPVTRYYLATANAQQGKTDDAMRSYAEVIDVTSESKLKGQPNNPMLADLRKNSIATMKTFNKAARFASLTLQTQWDNNVSTLPSDVDAGALASGQKTFKEVFSGLGGYSTSPLKRFQSISSLSIFTNYNLNSKARDLNFFSPTLSEYVLYRPFAKLSPGMKIEGTYNMKRQFLSKDGETKYRPYSLSGNFGPLVKYELNPKVTLAAEATWRPKKYYLDVPDSADRRSGHGGYFKISATHNSELTWWNPTVYLAYEADHTFGTTYRFNAIGGGLSNYVDVTEKISVTGYFDLNTLDYYRIRPVRNDVTWTLRSLASYTIDANWSAMLDLSYSRNDSSVPLSFKYNRTLASLGATYVF